jgi:very-short-patch-repair endonuclease
MQQSGSAVTVWIPLQIGGNEKIGISMNLKTFQWPRQADVALGYVDFHVDNNKLGIEFYGTSSSDYLYFTNCLFTSESSYYWRFNASHSASTVMSFAGSTVVNATVTLRSTVTLATMTFINCSSFTQNNAAISASKFTNTKITSDNPADISTCAFTSGGTGHAIEITTAGTYTFASNTFSGYGADATTNAAVYNNSGGAVTLNITGGVASPTIRNGAGASTTVNNNRTITLTGLQNPTEIRVFLAGTATEVGGTGAENVTTGTHNFSAAYDLNIDIVVLALGYQNLRILNYDVLADATLPISQVLDRQYANP